MTTIDINSIGNAKLKQLATEIDNSKISAKDNQIDDKEIGIFKQMAKTYLLDKKEITNDDYKAIFGLEKANNKNKTQSYEDYKEIDKQKTEINKLKGDIDKIRYELYKGNYDKIQNRGVMSENAKGASLGIGVLAATMTTLFALAEEATATSALIGGPLVGIAVGGVCLGGAYLYNKYEKTACIDKDKNFMQQCEKENPKLYASLKDAEKLLAMAERELAELQK